MWGYVYKVAASEKAGVDIQRISLTHERGRRQVTGRAQEVGSNRVNQTRIVLHSFVICLYLAFFIEQWHSRTGIRQHQLWMPGITVGTGHPV